MAGRLFTSPTECLDERYGPRSQDGQIRLAPSRLPLPNRILVHPNSLREIDLPPAPLAAVLPEPVGEGLARVARNGEGEFDKRRDSSGLFRKVVNLDCTGTEALPPLG